MTDQPFLSLCLIVKNEEDNIKRLLESVDVVTPDGEPAFDEIIIVDTGSTDRTKEIIDGHFKERSVTLAGLPRPSVTVADFEWVNDFAKARQFSFDLAHGRWRMFLDADDTFKARNLKAAIRQMEKNAPMANVFPLRYVYASGVEQPTVIRCVRWGDFEWKRPIHEYLAPLPGKQRVIGKGPDFVIIHHKTPEANEASLLRNHRIASKMYEDAKTPGERAEAAYFCSTWLRTQPGQVDRALELLDEAWNFFKGNNFGCYSRFEAACILRDLGRLDEAISCAAEIEAFSPEFKEGILMLGVLHCEKGDFGRAASFFDTAFARADYPLSSMDEVWFTKGLAPCLASLAYTELDRLADAAVAMQSADIMLSRHDRVRDAFRMAQRKLAQKTGVQRLKDFVDFLVWDTEAPKAVQLLLSDLLPSSIANHPYVQERRRDLQAKLKHYYGTWEDYKAAYASIPEDKYHTEEHNRDSIRASSRYEYVMRAVDHQSRLAREEGRTAHMLAIGFQDGNIEQDVLSQFDNVVLTVADVAPQASEGLKKLQALFPGRVNSHAIVKDAFDWVPEGGIGSFDLVTLLEVIEHVPGDDGDVRALRTLRKALVPDTGTLVVSTPVADCWVESYLTDPKQGLGWYGHVRAFNLESLSDLLDSLSLQGTLVEGWDGTFVTDVQYKGTTFGVKEPKDIAIVVPGTPKPFDAFGHLRGFTGGSEEAVIYLSEALSKMGHKVTVYCPEFRPEDSNYIRMHMGVRWKDIKDFAFFGDKHESVLFWRCPELILQLKDAPYRKVLWLHDYEYQSSPEAYQSADSVVILSDSHAKSIEECDGFKGPFHKGANGIDPSMFPSVLGQERDDKKVIYVSSPDRGLSRLLEEWPAIKEAVPEATLDIYYSWKSFQQLQPENFELLSNAVKNLEGLGVRHLGGVDQPTLHEAMRKASVWAYPNDGRIETFCISAVKSQACGLTPVTTDAGALGEVVLEPGHIPEAIIDTEEGRRIFRDRIIEALKNPETDTVREERRKRALEKFSWDKVARMFDEVL
jgi:glycosyltransferase involved in cell wall biosynthesis